MKADLHVHSKYSRRPSEWILKKLGCPESFTEPQLIYDVCRSRGMSLVTITDHNVIEGALEIGRLPGTFVSEEVTTYFPEDKCKLHVLVYGINEKIHQDIQKIRENVFDLTQYLRDKGIVHSLAHPLFSVNGKLTVEHFEKCLLLFKNFELNGARSEDQNRCLRTVLGGLTQEQIERLADRRNIAPTHAYPWIKRFTGGSDDHSSLTIACRSTRVPGASNPDDFLSGMESDRLLVEGCESTPKTLAHNIYGIAYQFYSRKFNLGRYVRSDLVLNLINRFLGADQDQEPGLRARLYFFWNHGKRPNSDEAATDSVLTLLQRETGKLISDDPKISDFVRNGDLCDGKMDEEWFHFVNRVSNGVLTHFTDNVLESFYGAHFLNLFNGLGSAGALYAVLAPYFVAFSLFADDRHFSETVVNRFRLDASTKGADAHDCRVAHFTDTFDEINGVARTLKQQIEAARRAEKGYTVVTCGFDDGESEDGIRNFTPIGVYSLSDYPEQKLFYPPFLEMLDYCYEQRFTHIHAATPGPLGLAALGIARILRLPFVGTYHTALPQYAQYLTEDGSVAELMWKYVLWFYDQMDLVYVPSRSTALELIEKGISQDKIRVFPRGVDTEMFHPGKRNGVFSGYGQDDNSIKLLYVGRISKEKNLEVLGNVFRSLTASTLNLRLIVVGDGPYRKEMEESLHGTPSAFMGYVEGEELASIYSSCDLFVFPSTTDTFGNVVLEAQASGLPVIVTDRGGPQENVIPGQTGLVVEGNSEAGLLDAIRMLAMDPARLKAMGKLARSHMEKRSFYEAFCRAWEIYSECGSPMNNPSNNVGDLSARKRQFDMNFFSGSDWRKDYSAA
jgi:glycosyltransferase involved in cell wall biosynthesis